MVVVGASTAGLYCAGRLAQGGLPVTLYEARRTLRQSPRSLIVTHRYRQFLGRCGDAAVLNEISRFELHAGRRTVEVHLRRPDLIIDRSLLAASLAETAGNAGVELKRGWRFAGLDRGDGRPRLLLQERTGDGPPKAVGGVRALVGADGAASAVARAAGFPDLRTVPLVQARVRLPASMRTDTTHVWFAPNDTPYFYWLIPERPGRGTLGVIGMGTGRDTRQRLRRFVNARGYEVDGYQAARIPEYSGWTPVHRTVAGTDVYLAGDAAGHVKVTTIGGIVNGAWGARAVAEAVLGNRRASRRALRLLRRELGVHLVIRRALHDFSERHYGALLDLLDAETKRTLGELHRDQAVRLVWSLLRRNPRIALLGLKGLARGTGLSVEPRERLAMSRALDPETDS